MQRTGQVLRIAFLLDTQLYFMATSNSPCQPREGMQFNCLALGIRAIRYEIYGVRECSIFPLVHFSISQVCSREHQTQDALQKPKLMPKTPAGHLYLPFVPPGDLETYPDFEMTCNTEYVQLCLNRCFFSFCQLICFNIPRICGPQFRKDLFRSKKLALSSKFMRSCFLSGWALHEVLVTKVSWRQTQPRDGGGCVGSKSQS